MSVGWIVVSVFTMFVALGMAEIVSAVPTAGGPYYWSAILAPEKHSAFAAWITGWYILLLSTLKSVTNNVKVQPPRSSRSYNRYLLWLRRTHLCHCNRKVLL